MQAALLLITQISRGVTNTKQPQQTATPNSTLTITTYFDTLPYTPQCLEQHLKVHTVGFLFFCFFFLNCL